MTRTVHARFDGEAFYPEEPLSIAPNTTVLLTVETSETAGIEPQAPPEGRNGDSTPRLGEPYSFLKYAMSLNLEGPEDWSENLEEYLYGDLRPSDD
jgi:hypothetical protein